MCKYCDYELEDNEPILETKFDVLGYKPLAQAWIRDDEIKLMIWGGKSMAPIKETKKKINYCPMCGRKLKEDQ